MTLISVAQDVAKDVGLSTPETVASSTLTEMVQLVSYLNTVADEIVRRVDWGALTGSTTLTGTGSAVAHSLPDGFSRLVRGIAVLNASGATVRQLSRPEWDALTMVEGVPRYFLLEGNTIRLWPFLASAAEATVYYQSGLWCSNGTASFTADGETVLFPEHLLTKGGIVRWRRQKGMDFADYEAEYEAALKDAAQFDDGSRL